MKSFGSILVRFFVFFFGPLGFLATSGLHGSEVDWEAYDPPANGTYWFEGSMGGYWAELTLTIEGMGNEPGTYTMEMAIHVPDLGYYDVSIIDMENGFHQSDFYFDDSDINFHSPPPAEEVILRGVPMEWSSGYDYFDSEVGRIDGHLYMRVFAFQEEMVSVPIGDFWAQRISMLVETEESWEENEYYWGGTEWFDVYVEMAFARGAGPVLIEMGVGLRDTFGTDEWIPSSFELVGASVSLALATMEGEGLRSLWGQDTVSLDGWLWNPRLDYFWAWSDGWIYRGNDHYWGTGTSDARHVWKASTGNWYFESEAHFPWVYGYTEGEWIIF